MKYMINPVDLKNGDKWKLMKVKEIFLGEKRVALVILKKVF
jgi:hypothetical protein